MDLWAKILISTDNLDVGVPTTTLADQAPTEESLIDCGEGGTQVEGSDNQPPHPPTEDSNLDLLSGGVDMTQPPTSSSNPQIEEDLLGGLASDGPSIHLQPTKDDNLVSLASEAPKTSEQEGSKAEKGGWDENWLLGPNKDENVPKNIEPGGDIDLLLLDK